MRGCWNRWGGSQASGLDTGMLVDLGIGVRVCDIAWFWEAGLGGRSFLSAGMFPMYNYVSPSGVFDA